MRAILASEFWAGATARGIVPGLRQAGWLVDEIDVRAYLPTPVTTAERIEARLRNYSRTASVQNAILRSARLHAPDVFLTVKGQEIRSSTLDTLRRQGVFTVNYYPDYHFNDIAIGKMAQYDLLATTKSFHLPGLNRIMPPGGAAFVHHGYTVGLHRPILSATPHSYDVLYVGNASREKAALMIAVADALPHLTMRVVGHRWSDYAAGTALQPAVAGAALSGDYYAAEIAKAKIVLAFHMSPDPTTGFADLVSTRSFEIPACGGFMLHIDNDEVRSLYDVPSEIDTFAGLDDLVTKIGYWLDHPVERAAVAARGHARAVPAYSYTERGLELAALIERKLGRTAT